MEANKNQDSEETQIPENELEQDNLESEDFDNNTDSIWKDAEEAAQEIEESKKSKHEEPVKAPNAKSSDTSGVDSAKLALIKAELEAKDNQLKRMAADFDNFRRRQALEREELLKNGCKDLITDLLPVLDNFERALAASRDAKDVSSVISGIEMIQKQLLDSFTKNGVEIIQALDNIFDPNYHEAVQQLVDDSKPDQTVINELQKGYTLNGKVIRPSMVVVSTVSS